MRLGYVNLTQENDLIPSSVRPGFLPSNLQDSRMTRRWGPITSGESYIDVGTDALTASMAVINAHNAQEGDTLKLIGYSDSSRETVSVELSFTYIEYGTALIFDDKTLYWRFYFDTADLLSVGGLFLGDHLIVPAYEIGHSWSEVAGDEDTLSATHQLYGTNPYQYRTAEYLLPYVTWDERADLSKVWSTVGKSKPFYLLQYPDRQDLRRVFYCHFTMDKLEWKEHENNIQVYKDLSLKVEEVF
jgi:hypothetical protein